MAEPTNTTTSVQQQVLDTVRASQDATVGIVRSWSETVAGLARPAFGGTVDSAFRFNQELWESGRQYTIRLLEAFEPVVGVAGVRARGTAGAKTPS